MVNMANGMEHLGPAVGAFFGVQQAQGALQEQSLDIQAKQTALDTAKEKLEADRRMQALMRDNPITTPGQVSSTLPKDQTDIAADNLYRMSEAAKGAGKYKESAEFAKNASELLKNKAAAAHNQALEDEADAKLLVGIISGAPITNQEEWNSAMQTYARLNPRAMQDPAYFQLAQTPYSPEMVQRLTHALTTQKDEALIRARDARTAREDAERALIPVRRAEIQSRTDMHKARTDNLIKNGGGSAVGLPKTEEIKEAASLIAQDYLTTQSDETKSRRDAAARDMVIEARKLLADNKDLTYNSALKQVYAVMKAKGEFAGLRPARRGPGSLAKPLPYPPARPSLDQQGQWYMGKEGTKYAGVPLFWTGENFLTKDEFDSMAADRTAQDDDGEED